MQFQTIISILFALQQVSALNVPESRLLAKRQAPAPITAQALDKQIDDNNAVMQNDAGRNPAEDQLLAANKQFETGQDNLQAANNKAVAQDAAIEAEMKTLDHNTAQYAADVAKDQKLDAATGAYQQEVNNAGKMEQDMAGKIPQNNAAVDAQLTNAVHNEAVEQQNVQGALNAATA